MPNTRCAAFPDVVVAAVQAPDVGHGCVFAVAPAGDGIDGRDHHATAFNDRVVDMDGRVWTSADDGVHCYQPDGTLIGKVRIPERVANVVFGGAKLNRLFICGTTSLYAVMVMVNGDKTF